MKKSEGDLLVADPYRKALEEIAAPSLPVDRCHRWIHFRRRLIRCSAETKAKWRTCPCSRNRRLSRTPMTNTKSRRTSWLKNFNTFNSRFFRACFIMRGVLCVQLMLVLAGGLGVSFCEGLSVWEGIYFALITSTSVGSGDITPDTLIGQLISVALALIGTVFFGLIVATRAVAVTVQESRDAHGDPLFYSPETS